MATGDLTTLDNVKAWFAPPLMTTSDDALLTRLVTAASAFIQTWLGRTIAQTSYSETRNGQGGTRLFLRNRPVVATASRSRRRPVPARPAISSTTARSISPATPSPAA